MMKPKWEPAVGDRVRVYDNFAGRGGVIEFFDPKIPDVYRVRCDVGGNSCIAHRKQMRRIVKRERRTWWIYLYAHGDGIVCAKRPHDVTGWLEVRVVRSKGKQQ